MANLNIPKGTQYSESHRNRNYDQVVKRTGQKFVAEELNYEGQIDQFVKEGLYKDVLGPIFIGNGFKVVAPAQVEENNNSVVVKAGRLLTRLGEINLSEDKTYEQVKEEIAALPANYRDYIYKATFNDVEPTAAENMITTPTNSRTDVLVLVVVKLLIGPDLDPQIQSVSLGEPSAYRYKLFYSLKIQKSSTLATSLTGFVYEDDFVCRMPLAVISRQPNTPLILDSAIQDSREYMGEIITMPIFKKVAKYITDIQGSGKLFNADKVDGRDVDDVLVTTNNLWTALKVRDYVEARAKGILPERYVLAYLKASEVPLNPAYGDRYIISQANGVAPRDTLKVDCIYTYTGTGEFDGFVETQPEQGMFLVNQDTGSFMLYSEEALEVAGIYGYHWLDFGGIADHASLANVLQAQSGADNAIMKHVTDAQYKSIIDNIAANASSIQRVSTSYETHRTSSTLDHADKSVTFDKVVNHTVDDTVALGTGVANVGVLLNRLAAAIKILSGSANWQTGLTNKFNVSGGTITGATSITDTTEVTTQGTGALSTAGGASIAKGLLVGGDVNIDGNLLAGNIPPTQEVIGFSVANNDSDPNNDIDFTTKSVAIIFNHDLSKILRPAAGTMTKQLNVSWVAGNNQGGLDTGTKAINTNYFMYIIWTTAGVHDYIFSASSTAPTLPVGFTYYRRLPGFVHTDASGNILGFIDEGDGEFSFKIRYSILNQVTPTASRVLLSTILPPNYKGLFHAVGEVLTTSIIRYINVGGTNETDLAPTISTCDIYLKSGSSDWDWGNSIIKHINTNNLSQIYYRGTDTTNYRLSIRVVGFVDKAAI